MSEKPEALRLAQWLLDNYEADEIDASAAELLRQHALIEEMSKALRVAVNQNEHDMLMTGEELRACRKALAKAEAQS